MVHAAAALMAVSLTCVALCAAPFVVPSASRVDAWFVAGSVVALASSTTLLGVVLRQRL